MNLLKKERALGCVMGAFIGDALGSYCEFQNKPNEKTINEALKMDGGGTFQLLPGQITDDSEMALSLSKGLVESEGKLNLNKICKYYCKWVNSEPFDIGRTTQTAFNPLYQYTYHKDLDKQITNLAVQVILSARYNNYSSLSNGCLMRITPLAIFCLNMDYNDVIQCVRQEVSLTHPNLIAQDACVAYILALIELINNGNAQQAMQISKQFIFQVSKQDQLMEWWNQIIEKKQLINGTPQMGFMKIAWTHSFVQLKNLLDYSIKKEEYKTIIRQILEKGGDTDTNCCIVGGMIGAYLGLNNIPDDYRLKFSKCDPTKSDRKRDEFYTPNNIVNDVNILLQNLPKTLTIIPREAILKNIESIKPEDYNQFNLGKFQSKYYE